MPCRDIEEIKTLGDLRKVVNEQLKDLSDDYEVDFMTSCPLDHSESFDLFAFENRKVRKR